MIVECIGGLCSCCTEGTALSDLIVNSCGARAQVVPLFSRVCADALCRDNRVINGFIIAVWPAVSISKFDIPVAALPCATKHGELGELEERG